MIDVHGLVQRQKKYMYYLLALLVLGWGFTSYKDVFLGLIIGTIFSFLSLRIIARRTDKLLDRVTNGKREVQGNSGKYIFKIRHDWVINFICSQISRVNRDVGPRCRIADRIPCHDHRFSLFRV